jgi:hypothetical protein
MICRLSRTTAQVMGEIAADWQMLGKLAPPVLSDTRGVWSRAYGVVNRNSVIVWFPPPLASIASTSPLY